MAHSQEFPRNKSGQTYGSAEGMSFDSAPDLIAAVTSDGKSGYVRRVDVLREVAPPKNPASALEQMNSRKAAGPRVMPVYLSDGTTRIGVFEIGDSGTATRSDTQ